MNFYIQLKGKTRKISIDPDATADSYIVKVDGEPYPADIHPMQPNVLSVLIEGVSYRVIFDPRPGASAVVVGEQRMAYRLDDPRSLGSRANVDANDTGVRPIIASMPGRIVRILVQTGAPVEAQQGLIVVEAMKMQNELKSPRAGNVGRIAVEVGATVQAGTVLMVIE